TLSAASGVSPIALIVAPQEPLGSAARKVEEFAARRAAGEPLSRIVGKREFWGLDFTISPQVLDPRPETETIVEASLRLLRDRRKEPLRILDLGVGSGALICALLSEFVHARGVGVDVSPGAANVARSNIAARGLANRAGIRLGDWTRGLEGPFDLIVSNPPYVPSADLPGLPREVREFDQVREFDPQLALDGGIDGLDAYRRILPESRSLLSGGGWLMVEIGAGQAADVLAIAEQCGLCNAMVDKDLAGLDRVVAARRP
ncbi:peptide chain release factor N(5)-glutamine methyltransferase, partial [Roseiarcus sp.]|uniref:peptide chain release factor N(5)-glutamine methyltransferase n=1 Tax=Roseiarcus sp. TaxID=1969460 RepID=UPI003D126CDD